MSLPDMSTPPRKRRAAVIVVSTAGALAVIAMVVIPIASGSAGTNGQGPPQATASAPLGASATTPAAQPPATSAPAKPPASAPAAPLPSAEKKAVEANIKDFLSVGSKSLAAPPTTPSARDFEALATGSALDSMVANSEDFANNGWHQEGAPKVVSVRVSDYRPSAAPPQVTLDVCLDSSKVNVVTADGAVVKKGSTADRSMNVLTLVKSEDKWLVSKESFPENPDC